MARAEAAALSQVPLEVVPAVDLNSYVGIWYEQARLPNRFQDKCAGNVTATYSLRQDGRIDVVNRCSTRAGEPDEARGVARLAGEQGGAKLKVRFAPAFLSFLPLVWGDYWIIGLDDDYQWAVVGEPDRKYLWILSRSQNLNDTDYERAVQIARDKGFDVTRLMRTPQGSQ